MPHKFDPARHARLDDPERRHLLPVRDLLVQAGLSSGMSVADVGCGPGFFTLPASEIVGPTGRVYAVDISPEMLLIVEEKARRAGLYNIETLRAEESAIPLPDAVAQVALVAFVLHEAVQPDAFVREVVRLLAAGGRLLLLEWEKDETPAGPPVRDRLTPEEAAGRLTGAGLEIVTRLQPNAWHYGLIAQVPGRPAPVTITLCAGGAPAGAASFSFFCDRGAPISRGPRGTRSGPFPARLEGGNGQGGRGKGGAPGWPPDRPQAGADRAPAGGLPGASTLPGATVWRFIIVTPSPVEERRSRRRGSPGDPRPTAASGASCTG